MNDKNKHSEEKKRRKWPWMIPLGILILIGLLRLFLITGFAHRLIKNEIVKVANQSLKPHLTVGKLSGNIWNQVTLTNIALSEDSTVASIDTLHLKYDLLSYFGHTLKIDEIKIVHPVLRLRRQQDSTWNAEHWVKSSSDTSESTSSYKIAQFLIKRGNIEVFDPELQKDSSFVIGHFRLAANNIHYSGEHYKVNVDTLGLKVNHTFFNSPVVLAGSADVSDSSFHLPKFTITTAHSVLNAAGKIDLTDTTGHFKMSADPLGWKDVAAYNKDSELHKNVDMSLRLNVNKKQAALRYNIQAQGIKDFAAHADFVRDTTIALTSLNISAEEINLATLLSDTTAQSLQNLKIKAKGQVPVTNYEKGELKGTLSAQNIHQGTYQLDALHGSLSIDKGDANLQIEPVKQKQRIVAEAAVHRLWSQEPSVVLTIKGSDMNPAVWMQDTTYAGRLNFNGRISGSGFFPEKKPWSYRLNIHKSELMGQPLNKAAFSGQFSQQMFTNQSDIFIANGELHLTADGHDLQKVPVFSYNIHARHLNLAGVKGYEQYTSNINGTLHGHGSGSSLEDLQLKTSALIDSSVFMKEPLQKLQMDVEIADSTLTIQNGILKSGIADGSLSGHLDIQDYYSPANSLEFQAKIKDISSLASMLDVDILQAKGIIKGEIKQAAPDSLIFEGQLNLKNINYGNEFTASGINGEARAHLQQDPTYSANLELEKPAVSSVHLQKIALRTNGQMNDIKTEGNYRIKIAGLEKSRITQAGTYLLNGDTTAATITDLTLSGAGNNYALVKPFHARMINDALQTDTLQIRSKDSAGSVELALPYADEKKQQGFVQLHKLNIAPLQKMLLDQSNLKGTVNSIIHFNKSDTSLKASGDVAISDFSYQGTTLDSLQLQAKIQNDQLAGSIAIQKDGNKLADAGVDIPFSLQQADSTKNRFLNKPIKGHITVHPVALQEFSNLIKQMGIDHPKGTFRLNGNLKGTVGQPKMMAQLSLKDGSLSKIPVDSLTASIKYQDQTSSLDLKTALTSLQQKMVEINAHVPFKINLQTFNISLPGMKDSISVDMQANKFNLKMLNDFMNHAMARNLEGFLNGDIHLSGPRDNLESNGKMTLSKGAVRLTNIGIRLDHIQSALQFKPDKIELANLQMESGKGSLHGHGDIGLKNMEPQQLDLSIKAQNFKVANTADYQAVINTDLDISGGLNSPKISGKLAVINGFVKLHNFGQKSVENVQLDTTVTAAPAAQTDLYDSLSLDLNLTIGRRFYVQNERYLKMQLGLEGDLTIKKEPEKDLHIFGAIKTTGGYAEPLGKHFNIEKGTLTFSGPPDNPELDIRTMYKPPQTNQEVKIWYIIQGTVEDPEFKYESDPPMDLSSILSYTLFGQPMYALSPGAQSATNAVGQKLAANFAMQFLANRVESFATTKLGIDVVKIENTHVGGKTGTAITTGWYINPKVFFAIQNIITGSTPSPGFYLEYYLKNNLKLILSQGTGNREGIGADLQWKHDY